MLFLRLRLLDMQSISIHETEVGAMENGVEKKYTFSKEPDSTPGPGS